MDLTILLFMLGLLVFASPLLDWMIGHGPWYVLYLLWLLIIVLGAGLFYLRGRRDF